jgi:hypothetical protein
VSVDKRDEEEELELFLLEEKKAYDAMKKDPFYDPISDIIMTKTKGMN